MSHHFFMQFPCAVGCQKEIATQIRTQEGDYVLALKRDQGSLHAKALHFFQQALEVSLVEAGCEYYCNEEKFRNCIEKREMWVTS
ncbi:MAG: hypothetical protein QRY74_00610 [Chlamydia sp.]